MSESHGSAARPIWGLCVVIGLLGACATGRHEAPSSQRTPSRSVERFTEECTGGNAEKCLALGLLYLEGNGVLQDASRAATLFEKACEGGVAQGCFKLGITSPPTRTTPRRPRAGPGPPCSRCSSIRRA